MPPPTPTSAPSPALENVEARDTVEGVLVTCPSTAVSDATSPTASNAERHRQLPLPLAHAEWHGEQRLLILQNIAWK